MIAHVIGAIILLTVFPLAIATILTFLNGIEFWWRHLIYGFATEAFIGAVMGLVTLGIWLLG